MSQLSRKSGILDVSQPFRSPQAVTGIASFTCFLFIHLKKVKESLHPISTTEICTENEAPWYLFHHDYIWKRKYKVLVKLA